MSYFFFGDGGMEGYLQDYWGLLEAVRLGPSLLLARVPAMFDLV